MNCVVFFYEVCYNKHVIIYISLSSGIILGNVQVSVLECDAPAF